MSIINPINETSVPYSSISPDKIGIKPANFRAPDKTRIGSVSLQIADLERSLTYYQNVIGFQVIARDETARTARLGTLDGTVLLELHEKPGVRFAPHRGRLGIYHFALLLPTQGDLGRFIAQALAQGVHVGQSDHLYSEASYLVDPDGITIEVYRDRPRAEWMLSPTGEVLGGAIPLDHDTLARAAGDTAWQGLPTGTTIGHMHFYVGDLQEAERFYHAGLGLTKMTWSYPGASFVSAGGYHHHVGMNIWAAGSQPSSDDDAKLLWWELVLPDDSSLKTAAQSLENAGFTVRNNDQGFQAADPWGIQVRLLASTTV